MLQTTESKIHIRKFWKILVVSILDQQMYQMLGISAHFPHPIIAKLIYFINLVFQLLYTNQLLLQLIIIT